MRIASLVPSSTEMLFALGFGDQVVAVTHECDFPPEAAALPHLSETVIEPGLSPAEIDAEVKRVVGQGDPLYRLKAEVLESVRPDLIIAQDVCAVCAVSYDDVLAIAARLPGNPVVLKQDPTSLVEVLGNAIEVAEATGNPEAGVALKAELDARIESVRSAVSGKERPTVLALEWLDPPFTGGHWVPEMIEIAGGRDLVGKAGLKSAEHGWDELANLDPDLTVVMPCGYYVDEAATQADDYMDRIRSTGAERTVAVDAAASFSRPGPRLIDGIELLAGLLHPEVFPLEEGQIQYREMQTGDRFGG
ncbi:MAG TPA: cobalamin-binding protein [Solirubrobacterales bacterium]|nr:cobalamin-binding protein [Solirubrobacterales bacterium]HMU26189.1 cobalamin-binding protein [Solirubrobacterales bacterium]HMX70300.1 cobalamin-binding protein [Solirubrobacterales bacterium]HMY25799.1 cobalamin-binding protein [Solirubrobacterales bacterium]HNA23667.1 cobalamin-binding protein [Solirubrobacterales bacterium]